MDVDLIERLLKDYDEYLRDIRPVKFENAFSAVPNDHEQLVGTRYRESPSGPGRVTTWTSNVKHET